MNRLQFSVDPRSTTGFGQDVEVIGHTVAATIAALPVGERLRARVLNECGIGDLQPERWYPQAAWLRSFEILSQKCGEAMLFAIGRQIPDAARFPAPTPDIVLGLRLVNSRYRSSHRGGEIGHYKVVEIDVDKSTATVECWNPYPSAFDRGLLTEIAMRYASPDAGFIRVDLDPSGPSRAAGDDRCRFIVRW